MSVRHAAATRRVGRSVQQRLTPDPRRVNDNGINLKARTGLLTPSIHGGSMVSAFRLGVVITTALMAAGVSAQSRPTYKDPAAPVEQRVQDLLSRMTLEERSPKSPPSGPVRTSCSTPKETSTRRPRSACIRPASGISHVPAIASRSAARSRRRFAMSEKRLN